MLAFRVPRFVATNVIDYVSKDPKCSDCKYFIKENRTCKLFIKSFNNSEIRVGNNQVFVKNYLNAIYEPIYLNADDCRLDQRLCRPHGMYFKQK